MLLWAAAVKPVERTALPGGKSRQTTTGAPQSRNQSQTDLNAETQRTAEKRREKELSANLCESLRLCVESPQAASKFIYCSTRQRSLSLLPGPADRKRMNTTGRGSVCKLNELSDLRE